MRLEGKTIVITGAASGIGFASAERALAEGARVIGVDLNDDGMPDGIEPVVGDVTSEETIARAVAAAGEIHGLGTIAGISRSGVAIDAIDPNEKLSALGIIFRALGTQLDKLSAAAAAGFNK